jgi:hypothetical protein
MNFFVDVLALCIYLQQSFQFEKHSLVLMECYIVWFGLIYYVYISYIRNVLMEC